MDKFEETMKTAPSTDGELGPNRGQGSRVVVSKSNSKRNSIGGRDAAIAAADKTGGQRNTAIHGRGPFYRSVVRGLGAVYGGAWQERRRRGGREGRWSMSCLSVCSRKPLLAGISRPSREFFPKVNIVDAAAEKKAVVGRAGEENGSGSENNRKDGDGDISLADSDSGRTRVELQVWNYRTKRLLVSHPFEQSGGDNDTENTSRVVDSGRGATMATRSAGTRETAEDDGGSNQAFTPVALSFHPSGDCIAIAFPHHVSVFFIVGGSCEGDGRDDANGDRRERTGAVNTLSLPPSHSTDASRHSATFAGRPSAAAVSSRPPLATLRSDQREFLTKGMFSVSGEADPLINYDPVSAVHYSPGGHLLAVVTGKVKSGPIMTES